MNDTLEKTTTPDDLWSSCLSYIKERITDQAFQTWFSGVILSSSSKESLVLQVPNKFHFEWLESKYRLLIDDAVKKVFSKPLIINYSVVISEKTASEIPNINETKLVELIVNRSKIYSKAKFKINCQKLSKKEITKKIISLYEKN